MNRKAFLDAHRRLGLTVYPGLYESLTDTEKASIVTLAEAGRRHAGSDLQRLDAAIRTLIDVRYDDDITRNRARKALDALLNIKDALGDPADPDADGELSGDPEDEAKVVADSKKVDKAVKGAEKVAATAAPAAKAEPASGGEGARTINLKIAASADSGYGVFEEGEGPFEFVGTVTDITDSHVTFDVEGDEPFSATFEHDDIESFEVMSEANPRGINQYSKGARGRVKARRAPQMPKNPISKDMRDLASGAGSDRNSQRRVIYRSNKMSASVEGSSVLAEGEADGSTWDVLLIQPGTSKNRRRYRREVLQEAVARGAFEGARAFAPDGPDHFGFGPFGRRRGTKEIVGWWSDIAYQTDVKLPSGKTAEGVTGTFHVSEAAPWLRTMLRDSWTRGKPDLIGWSIVGDGPWKVVRDGDGRPVADVEKVVAVESIDPVVNPAAGGSTIRLVASQEGSMDWSKLTLAEAVRALATGTILPDELRENRPDLATKLVETDFSAADNASGQAADAKALVEAEMAKFRTVQSLEAKLAQRPKLAEAVKGRIREKVTAVLLGSALTEAELDGIIKDEVEYVGAFAPASLGSGTRVVEDVKDERDRMVEYAYAGLKGDEKDFSIARFYVDLTGDKSFSGKSSTDGRLSESITSTTFGEIMGDSITRRMLDYYNLPGLDAWKAIVNTETVRDFRTYRRIRYGGYGNLPAVNQGAAYTSLSSPTDEEATFAVSKRGGTEDMTLESIANDDLGAMRDIPRRLGRAAAQTLHEFCFDFLAGNGAIYDTVALAHATHNNTGTTALDATTLTAGRNAMLKQADMSNSKRLGIRPKSLVVPIDLEQKAYELTATDREVASANNTLNFVRQFGLQVIRVDYWSDANNWWLVADPNEVPTINIAFFNGNEQPELFVQDQPTNGANFTNDKVTYKIRHIYGGAVMDFRGFYGAIVP